jgi:hypothetical protein
MYTGNPSYSKGGDRGIAVLIGLSKNVRLHVKKTTKEQRTGLVVQVVEHLSSKSEALSSFPTAYKMLIMASFGL